MPTEFTHELIYPYLLAVINLNAASTGANNSNLRTFEYPSSFLRYCPQISSQKMTLSLLSIFISCFLVLNLTFYWMSPDATHINSRVHKLLFRCEPSYCTYFTFSLFWVIYCWMVLLLHMLGWQLPILVCIFPDPASFNEKPFFLPDSWLGSRGLTRTTPI